MKANNSKIVFPAIRIFLLLFFLAFFKLYSQETIIDIEENAYHLNENEDENANQGLYAFNLFEEDISTIDINKCNQEDLRQLGILTDLQIIQIIQYREALGDFLDIHELQAVPKVDEKLAENLARYLFVRQEHSLSKIKNKIASKGKTEIYTRFKRIIENQRGYDKNDQKYEGNPSNLLLKIKHSRSKDIMFNFIAEKDAGESFFKNSNPMGFDYYAGQLVFKNTFPWLKSLYLGDFKLNLGQGLLAKNGFNAGKGKDVLNIVNHSRIYNAHSSSSESGFLRGVGIETKFKKMVFSAFASIKKIDASLDTLASEGNEEIDSVFITSLLSSGLHRTMNEIAKKRVISNAIYGLRSNLNLKRFSVALNWISYKYEFPIVKKIKIYNVNAIQGETHSLVSIDHRFNVRNLYMAGELAFDPFQSIAFLEKAQISLARNLDISMVYRYYSPSFHSYLGRGFGEGATSSNEQGFYFSALYFLDYNIKLSAFVDIWKKKWLSYSNDAPSYGRQYLIHFYLKKKRKYELNASYEFKVNEKTYNSPTMNFIKTIANSSTHKLRLQMDYYINSSLKFRNRVEYHFVQGSSVSKGFLFYHDIIFKPFAYPLSITARYALFDIQNFDARIYAYENDLLHNFSIPAYLSKGNRYYINIRYKINKIITLEGRFARSYYPEDNEISNGNDKIEGNTKSELKFQMRIKF